MEKNIKKYDSKDLPTRYIDRYNFLKDKFVNGDSIDRWNFSKFDLTGTSAKDVPSIIPPPKTKQEPTPTKSIYESDVDYEGKYLDIYINDHHVYRTETFNLKRGETLSLTPNQKILTHEYEKVLKILDHNKKDITDDLAFNIHVKEI